jgi:NAD(P)-dependent dehydrogenase (short-subunit alcohol dehydrogenase family)
MLTGKRILVTGASRGIGRAIAVACAAAGAQVGVNYHRSEDQARSLCETLGPSMNSWRSPAASTAW